MRDLQWESIKWRDGTTYEGLAKEDKSHTVGICTHADGSRYEGEWHSNKMQGFGVYVWPDGTIYRGEFEQSKLQGCGVRLQKQGSDFKAEEGHFHDDRFLGQTLACSVGTAQYSAAEADGAAQRARRFQLFPDNPK